MSEAVPDRVECVTDDTFVSRAFDCPMQAAVCSTEGCDVERSVTALVDGDLRIVTVTGNCALSGYESDEPLAATDKGRLTDNWDVW